MSWVFHTWDIRDSGAEVFQVDLFTLAMAEADIVLRIQWLHMLGKVVWDFVYMHMHFCKNGKEAYFGGCPKVAPCGTFCPEADEGSSVFFYDAAG